MWNGAFVRDVPRKPRGEFVKTSGASLDNWKVKLLKRSFRARPPFKSEGWSNENEVMKTKLSCETSITNSQSQVGKTTSEPSVPMRGWSENDPPYSQTCSVPVTWQTFPIYLLRHVLRCKTQHFAHPLSLKNASRGRLPFKTETWSSEHEAVARGFLQKTESCRCEYEAFLPDILQKLKVEVGKTMLLCETSLQKWNRYLSKKRFMRDFP